MFYWVLNTTSELDLSRPYPFNFYRGCFPQILLGPFWNTLSHFVTIFLTFALLIWKRGTLIERFKLEVGQHKYVIRWNFQHSSLRKCLTKIVNNWEPLIIIIKNSIFGVRQTPECTCQYLHSSLPACIYLFKVSNRNTRTRCQICSKLTIKTTERRYWFRFDVFIVNFEHISHLL